MSEEKKFTPAEAAVISESVRESEKLVEAKLKSINWLMAGVVIVLFMGFITMIIMVATLLLDTPHFDSAIYKEYSEKNNTLDSILKNNEVLLQGNKQNQQMILEQQKEIQELLKKK